MKTRTVLGLALVLVLALVGVAMAVTGTPSTPVSDGGIPPYVIPGAEGNGHRTCQEVSSAFFGHPDAYNASSYQSYHGKDLAWSTEDSWGIGAVIVWGGGDANVYVYNPPGYSDSGLSAAPNQGGGEPDVSWIGFCWLEPD